MTWWMSVLFNIGFLVYGIFSLPFFILRTRQEENPNKMIRQRLGWLTDQDRFTLAGRKVIWLHAVSVGEAMAIQRFTRDFLAKDEEVVFFLTTVTPTGQSIASQLKSDRIVVSYFPFDWTFSVQKVLNQVRPVCMLLTETEIWPNLITACKKRNIPVGLINARLSLRSAGRYLAFRWIFVEIFAALDFVLAQNSDDAERFCRMGTAADRIKVLGNMKFDHVQTLSGESPADRTERNHWKLNDKDVVLIAGSTHDPEEAKLGKVYQGLKNDSTSLKLILAPRHIERSKRLCAEFKRQGLNAVLASQLQDTDRYDILILDRLGVLKNLYQIADLVFMGGSLIAHGGQNPIEPAAYRKPILYGPHVFNFNHVYRSLDQAQGAVCVRDEAELQEQARQWIEQPLIRERTGQNACRVIQSLQGASERHVNWIRDYLKQDREERKEHVSRNPQLLPTSGNGL